MPLADPALQPAATPAPKRLDEVLGQDHALDVLTRALDAGRIHHAWIFHGPMGVGKRTTALAFAALLLDSGTQRTFSGVWEADPMSKASQLLAAGTHPDLHLITKELALYDEDRTVRERKLATIPKAVITKHLIEPSQLASQMQGGLASKVFIIDEAELLDRSLSNAPVQNAILKTLEEPPDRTVIILITSNEDRLLPTIRSRCHRVRFGPLTSTAFAQWSRGYVAQRASGSALHTGNGRDEDKDSDDDSSDSSVDSADFDSPGNGNQAASTSSRALSHEAVAWLTEFADGSPGIFALAADEGFHEWAAKLAGPLDSAIKGTYSLALGPVLYELAEGYSKGIVAAAENASKEAANRKAADWLLRLVCTRLRASLRTSVKQVAAGTNAATRVRTDSMLHAIDAVREAESELDANVNPLFVFEKLAAEIAAGHA